MAMPNLRSSLRAAALLTGFVSLAAAQTGIVQNCPTTGICYSLSVPQSSASSGSGDIYFQIQAPTTYSWVSLGQGHGMSGSNIFVMYTDATGQNVTVSPRIGTGNVMPQHDTQTQLTVLEGSGVANGMMTANVRCSNCHSWSGGSMDFSSSSTSWIYAWKSGSPLDTNALDATIREHDTARNFNWDLSTAQSSSGGNPFVASGTTSGSGSGTGAAGIPATCTPIQANSGSNSASANSGSSSSVTSTSSGDSDGDGDSNGDSDGDGDGRPSFGHHYGGHHGGGDDDGDGDHSKLLRRQTSNGCPSGYAPISASSTNSGSSSDESSSDSIVLAHGVLAALAFVVLFPTGGMLIRLASFRGLVWVHAAVQVTSYLLYIVAFGLGVWLAGNMQYLDRPHAIIGIVLFVVILAQPVTGLLHHKMFAKYHARTLWSYVHVNTGRSAILLGIINGGLGLQLKGETGGKMIAYSVVAAIFGTAYIAAMIYGEIKRKRAPKKLVDETGKVHGPMRDSESGSQEMKPLHQDAPTKFR